jgi:Fur family transcriptional regulator, ferric uptake regulator
MNLPQELRDSGLKATAPRLRILQLFHEGAAKHLTAEHVYRRLLDEKHDVGLATVYRVLLQFSEAGILIRHHFDSGRAVFELNESHHHDHMVCTTCGKVEEFVDAEIERRQSAVAKARGFTIREHTLSLFGRCAECARGETPRVAGRTAQAAS